MLLKGAYCVGENFVDPQRFLTVPLVSLQYVVVVFLDHTRLLI